MKTLTALLLKISKFKPNVFLVLLLSVMSGRLEMIFFSCVQDSFVEMEG